MAGQPWFQFFPGDWLRAADLRAVSPAARGLWMDLLCFMHQSEPRGFLLVNGSAPTRSQLARMTGCDDTELRLILGELESSGVLSRDENGVIYNRRMLKEAHISSVRAKAGKRGAKRQQTGRQNVSKTSANVSAKVQQNSDSDSNSLSVEERGVGKGESGLPAELDSPEFVDAWRLFLEHRKSIRKALKPLAREQQLKILAGWVGVHGMPAVIESMRATVANQWQGLFEPKQRSDANGVSGKHHQHNARPSAEQQRQDANLAAIAEFASRHAVRPRSLFPGDAGSDGVEAHGRIDG